MSKYAAAKIARLLPFRKDDGGSVVVEFALLAPVFLMMIFGIFQTGIYLQNYNAVQSIASDAARFVMVEYQKDNQLTDEQVQSVILGRATNAPYLLDTDRMNVVVDRSGTSRVTGAVEIDISINYTLSDFIPGVELPLTVIRYSRSVWVVT
jgi:Flp pilus assembly protein TadG